MSGHKPGASYLASPRSVALHRRFVENVRQVLAARSLLWDPATTGGKAAGQPKYDELSAMCGVPRRTLENIFNLHNQPSMVGAAALCQSLGVSIDQMLGEEWTYTTPAQLSPDGATSGPVLKCIHTNKWQEGSTFCTRCLTKWQAYQSRIRNLWEARRSTHVEGVYSGDDDA